MSAWFVPKFEYGAVDGWGAVFSGRWRQRVMPVNEKNSLIHLYRSGAYFL
jgi:hypothetical protein